MTQEELIKATPASPEPPQIDRLEHTPPSVVYRNSWRHGWAEGYRASLLTSAPQEPAKEPTRADRQTWTEWFACSGYTVAELRDAIETGDTKTAFRVCSWILAGLEYDPISTKTPPTIAQQAGTEEAAFKALETIAEATKEPSGGSYWPMREWLDARDVWHGDLSNERVINLVAVTALAAYRQSKAGSVQP